MTQSARPKYEITLVRLNEGYDLEQYLWQAGHDGWRVAGTIEYHGSTTVIILERPIDG